MAGRDIREIIRDEMVMRDRIIEIMKRNKGPMTVPEVAEKLGYPSDEVMYWMMGMRKYGYIEETKDITEDGYFRYELTDKGRGQNGS